MACDGVTNQTHGSHSPSNRSCSSPSTLKQRVNSSTVAVRHGALSASPPKCYRRSFVALTAAWRACRRSSLCPEQGTSLGDRLSLQRRRHGVVPPIEDTEHAHHAQNLDDLFVVPVVGKLLIRSVGHSVGYRSCLARESSAGSFTGIKQRVGSILVDRRHLLVSDTVAGGADGGMSTAVLAASRVAGHVRHHSLQPEIDSTGRIKHRPVQLHHRFRDGRTRCIVNKLLGTNPNVFTKCCNVLRSSGSGQSSIGKGSIRDTRSSSGAKTQGLADYRGQPVGAQAACTARWNATTSRLIGLGSSSLGEDDGTAPRPWIRRERVLALAVAACSMLHPSGSGVTGLSIAIRCRARNGSPHSRVT